MAGRMIPDEPPKVRVPEIVALSPISRSSSMYRSSSLAATVGVPAASPK